MKTLNKITSILLSGILFGMFAAPMQINAEETVELLPLEANEHSTLETRATNGTFVYRKSLGTIGSGSYKFTLTAILLINDKTGVIESAELVSSGPSDCSCLYNIDAYDYEVYFTVTVFDHKIFGIIDHALVTLYYTVKTPGIMR